jgi:hypothetical protein
MLDELLRDNRALVQEVHPVGPTGSGPIRCWTSLPARQ